MALQAMPQGPFGYPTRLLPQWGLFYKMADTTNATWRGGIEYRLKILAVQI